MKAQSPRGTETKLRIIRAAADLFHKQGARATSPDQVIEASGTGKGQFYHYFKNKDGLVHEVLLHHLEAIESGTAPVNYEITSWDDLERWLAAHVEAQKSFRMTRGCPFGTIGNEVTENDDLIRSDMNLLFEIVKNKLASFFSREKGAGRLAKEADEVQLAELCLATVQGGMLLGKIRRSAKPVEATFRELLAHLKRYVIPRRP
jgi:AcrR family transcriptional regulator